MSIGAAPLLQPVGGGGLGDRVADQLRRAIQQGVLPPGARLVERTIARDLRTSHIPVREALARLAREGLVEHEPRRGARVATLTAERLEELSSLRIVLEQFVVRRVQERWTPEAEAGLRALVEELLRTARAGDAEGVVELDQAFHERLWELADHALLNEVAAGVRARVLAFLRATTLPLPPEELVGHAATHRALLDAVASGDRARAEREAERHVRVAAERVRHVLLYPCSNA